MAYSVKVGSIASPASTGNQATTGVGFQPKAILFFATQETADGTESELYMMMGMGVSSSSRASCSVNNTSSWGGRHDNTKCINEIDSGNSVLFAADFVSMDSDGFTVNWTTVSNGMIINYVALGGTDLSNVFLKQFQAPAATGNQASTGVGFQPDAMILMSIADATAPANTQSSLDQFGWGFATASAQGAISEDWSGSTINSYQRTTDCIDVLKDGGHFLEAAFTSFDSDGFTINFSTTTNGAYIWALCLKGGNYKVGSYNKPTATGNSAVTGVGFTPTGLIQTSFGEVASTSIQHNDAEMAIGAASATNARGAIVYNNLQFFNNLDRTKLIKTMSNGPTVDGAADLTSFDSDGFTQNWSTANATAQQILYFTVGSSGAVPAATNVTFKNLLGVGI